MAWIVGFFFANDTSLLLKYGLELTPNTRINNFCLICLVSFSMMSFYSYEWNRFNPTACSAKQMSVVVPHGEEEGEDGSHHQGDQLCLREARFPLSAMRVPVSHICHLREHMHSCHIKEGACTE